MRVWGLCKPYGGMLVASHRLRRGFGSNGTESSSRHPWIPLKDLKAKRRPGRTFTAALGQSVDGAPYEPTEAVLDQLCTVAPGWDLQGLVARYRQWSKGKVAADNPHGAFLGWAKKFTKHKAPS